MIYVYCVYNAEHFQSRGNCSFSSNTEVYKHLLLKFWANTFQQKFTQSICQYTNLSRCMHVLTMVILLDIHMLFNNYSNGVSIVIDASMIKWAAVFC